VRALKAAKVIRQIRAIFDTPSLGYASSLVAAKIAPERLDTAVTVINSRHGIIPNDRRRRGVTRRLAISI
jgi:siroheme decarboxylase